MLLVTLGLNLVVVVAKISTGLISGALSVVAEGVHSSVDALNNVIGLALARVAAQEPDEDHPYGHAKFETLGALAIVGFLSVTVFELVSGAVNRLVQGGEPPRVTPVVVGVMVASAFVSAGVSSYELRRGRELDSDLLMADAKHTRADLYASVAVLVGLALVALGYAWADPIFTLVVAVLIARTGWEIVRASVPILVDERALEEAVVRDACLEVVGVLACYHIRSRGRPGERFVELTIGVSPRLGIRDAHAISDRVEEDLARRLAAREVLVHVEPAETR